MAAEAEASTAADLVAASMAGEGAFPAGAWGGITEEAGVVAGMVAVPGMAGVTQAGDAAGVGVIRVGVGELASALVGAGVLIGAVTRMHTAILMIIPTRITDTLGRKRMRQRITMGIAVATAIRVTTRSIKIRAI